MAEYGLLAQGYVESFEQKWILRDPAPSDELLGAADIQSLAAQSRPFERTPNSHA